MNKEEFIGKLQMVYVGDKRASEEIISEYDRLKGALQTHEILLKTNVEEIDRLNNLNKQLVEECQKLDDEETRLNNIINRIDNFVDRTIEVIKQQPSDNDEWILERLNGIKYLIELKENNKDV